MGRAPCDVVHIVNQLRPGGIETMVLDIATSSRLRTRIFSLECSAAGLVADWPRLAPLEAVIEGFEKPPGLGPALVGRIAQRLRQLQPRAVFLHRTNPLLYGGLAARIARIPVVVHVEHDVWQYADPKRARLLRWAARLVRPLHFAVSAEIAEALERMLPEPQVRVVPGGIDLERFRRRPRNAARSGFGLPLDAALVGTAGRLEEIKGHHVLVEALALLPENTHALIVGDGSRREHLLAMARERGVESRLHLLGHRDDVEQVISALDVFCLPSLGEGLPRVVMEAQAADIPIVASDVGSVAQIVDPATGRMVKANDAPALAAAIAASLASPPVPGACRAFAEARFSIARMVEKYDSTAAG